MLKKIVEITHDSLIQDLKQKDVAIDFTCGSGYDSEFLCRHFTQIYSYDIQECALEEARKRCENYSNIHFFHKSHLYFDEDVSSFDCGIFNLGYYPKGAKEITTQKDIVLKTLDKGLTCLNQGGKIIIVCYPGFEQGKQEAKAIDAFVSGLPSKSFDVFKFQIMNRKNAPYILGILKHE